MRWQLRRGVKRHGTIHHVYTFYGRPEIVTIAAAESDTPDINISYAPRFCYLAGTIFCVFHFVVVVALIPWNSRGSAERSVGSLPRSRRWSCFIFPHAKFIMDCGALTTGI
ncbi:hypothetical protein KCP73_18770 [Salmonella enterica subsp. enterica]|nr:hypothetical protein KCP73_18770 [Salmonella enterica subsp. enterica]